jgi:hypothetical protein
MLYVSVGDGFKSLLGSQQLDSPLGKILRMDLARQVYVALGSGEGGGVMRFRYGFEDDRLLDMPEYFVKETGESKYHVGWPSAPMASTWRP